MSNLLFCDNDEELMWLKEHCSGNYVIATSNFSFYNQIKSDGGVFLESNEIIRSEETWQIIEQINKITRESEHVTRTLIYQLSYQLDSGLPEEIALFLSNLNLIALLTDKYQVQNFYTVDNKANWFMNECIFIYTKSRLLNFYILDGKNGNRQDYLYTMRYVYKDSGDKIRNQALRKQELEKLKTILNNPVYKKTETEQWCQTGVLYCERDCMKHVTWTKQYVSAIGHDVKIISFYHSGDNEKLKEHVADLDCLEDYFSLKIFRKKYLRFVRDRNIILKNLQQKLKSEYKDIDISLYLLKKVVNYYYREVLGYVYMDSCAEQYFAFHRFNLIRIWGDSNFWQTQICYENTRNDKTKLFRIFVNGVLDEKLYEPNQNIIHFFFCPNEQVRNSIINKHYTGNVYFISDVIHGADFYENSVTYHERENGLKVLILPTSIAHGMHTYFEYNLKYPYLLRYLSRLKCTITFKNHASMDEFADRKLKEEFGSYHNITFMDQAESCYDVLACCDLVITDISTIIFDAACFRKPVLCVVDNNQYQLIKHHRRGFMIYRSPESVCRYIRNVIENDLETDWIVERQNQYMEEILGGYDENIQVRMRKILECEIHENMEE